MKHCVAKFPSNEREDL